MCNFLEQARAEKAGQGGGAPGREERMRWTALVTDARRRMEDTNKTLRSLQADPIFMVNARRPGTPEAERLEILKSDLQQYQQDHTMWTGLLAGPEGAKAREDQGGGGKPKPGAKPDPTKIQGLPNGATIGGQTAKGWEVKDASGKLLGYVKE